MVIVTKNQYILASKIHHIVLNEHYEYNDIKTKSGRHRSVRELSYMIDIMYTRDNAGTNPHNDMAQCTVTMRGKVHAYKVYKDLINQIREQSPDELFLDKALENLLNDDDFKMIEESDRQDKEESEEMVSDRSTTKIRRPRKAKGSHKAILRAIKASPKRRR